MGLAIISFSLIVFFLDAYEVYIDNTELLFSNGTSIGVHWSPISILPVVDPQNYTVDIKLMEVLIGSQELAMLGTNLPNTGLASVTVPPIALEVIRDILGSITPVIVQVSISSDSTTGIRPTTNRGTDSDILRSLGNSPLKHSPIRYALRVSGQEEQRRFCDQWERTQVSPATRNARFGALPPCPRNVMVARAPNSGFIEERLSSRVRVVGTIPGYTGDRIVDNEHREYFNPGASACFLQRSVNPR